MSEAQWQPWDTVPKDCTSFYALIGGLPYIAKYDEHGRFCWKMHGNIGEGAIYRIHEKDGKRLLEETKEAEYDYQPQWYLWRLGFEHKPSHWQPIIPIPISPPATDETK